ncbi:MAG TPA: class I SAM-dependent methyltransferase [Streptosporangiaceae bacterium]|jgi:SAM-dependent methyltransferase|nr:class I SAM-dependent methyltransferase [Streptosporangiaceae bacterium]
MVDATTRFSSFASDYDRVRPQPPALLAEVISQWAGVDTPAVIDIGTGSGLSLLPWSGRARKVTGVEPSGPMREIARQRAAALPDGQVFTVVEARAEDTGLPDGSADIVTASQAMHWFDADRALPEIVRLLRPGGVLAAYDCDWPPFVDWETDAAYVACEEHMAALETSRDLQPPKAAKEEHTDRMRASGLFRFVTEIAVHHQQEGNAERLVALIRSQGGTVALLREGLSEEQLGLTRLAEVADRRIPGPVPFWWTYRVRLAVR